MSRPKCQWCIGDENRPKEGSEAAECSAPGFCFRLLMPVFQTPHLNLSCRLGFRVREGMIHLQNQVFGLAGDGHDERTDIGNSIVNLLYSFLYAHLAI